MKYSKTTLKEIHRRLNLAIKSLGNFHHLSEWERGQGEGLLWAKQILDEMLDSDKFLDEKNPTNE